MQLKVISTGIVVALFSLAAVQPAEAQSGLDACGNIWIEAQPNCEVEPPGIECTARCTPLVFEASCASDLAISCQAGCEVDITTELPVCQTACETECNKDPPQFECHTSCEARCGASCSGNCSANSSAAHCEASCHASCGLNCDTECRELPPTESCETKCEHSCTGSLKADLSIDCQADCQTSGFIDCEAKLDGGCKLDCESTEGALFCDNQFVDHDGNLDKCIDALKSLDALIDFKASASGEVSVGCSMAQPEESFPVWSMLPLIGLFAGLILVRRRRK